MTFTDEETKVLWAAMWAMVHGVHAPRRRLTDEQWELAEKLHERIDSRVNEMDGSSDREPLKDITGCDV